VEIALDSKVEKSSNTKFVKDIKREIEKKRKELSKTDKFNKEAKRNLKNDLRSLREDIKGSYRNTVIDIYSKSKVILATCVGASDPNLKESLKKYNSGTFDMVVIDECAQATEALCWISVLLGKKLVLAGDHLQLPPTIKSKEAEKKLSFTLFDRMIKSSGDKCAKLLNIQYRMNESIMNFSSKELYESKLVAHESVKSHKVIDMLEKNKELQADIEDRIGVLDKNLLYINTNGFEFYESIDIDSTSRLNLGEAKICKFLVDYLKSSNIDFSSVGIITPYSAQVNTLRTLLPVDDYKDLEISTVDGFQGREKEIIILSLVRSNKRREIGFLADNRRLNVAITRARRMVALVCDVSTVSNHPFLKKMCTYFDDNAHEVGIMDNIFDFREIEDIKYECQKNSEKELPKDTQKKEKEKAVNNQTKAQAQDNKKNKKDDRDKNKDKSNQINIDSTETFTKNEEISTKSNNAVWNKNPHTKAEVNLEFINKIKSKIENFLNSKNDEFTIEGLSNSERRYIHYYAEIKHLIHESQGENENRVMVIRKPQKNNEKIEEKKPLEVVENIPKILNKETPKTEKSKKIETNKGGIMVNPDAMVKQQPVKTVTASHKIKIENVKYKINYF
jgi:ATP-dependent RNA/DNA helicase IGHMBP2